ncbi:hypothetical protein [Streptomyces uncialis]|uniref:Uncharacterized protein n=1 Tax=Streptomyces uncialis TaxID=1048205 RepID=A0A1Q4VC96_9ACTN|nr:hypothetical protein [Streptomyces uncialis]OKH95436.1 hypothetical protein AB852_00830 [Streptomyces uncialis]
MDDFENLVGSLETKFNAARLEKHGIAALTTAKIAGALYLEAVTAGVPHVLAQEMAQDFWHSETGAPAYVVVDEEEAPDADH